MMLGRFVSVGLSAPYHSLLSRCGGRIFVVYLCALYLWTRFVIHAIFRDCTS